MSFPRSLFKFATPAGAQALASAHPARASSSMAPPPSVTPAGSAAPSSSTRRVARVLKPNVQREGVGAIVSRSIGRPEQSELDPFLLFDHASVQAPAGFPDHPHRGFETVSYLLKGKFTHEDFAGHRGDLNEGDLQWMTAGRGIVHSEKPASKEEAQGLQLWVNLPASQKMCEPAYQELKGSEVPLAEKDGVTAKVIAGTAFGVTSPVYTRTPTAYLDFRMGPGTRLEQAIPEGWNAFAYVLEGSVVLVEEGSKPVEEKHTVILERSGANLVAWNKGSVPNRFILIAGQPLGEPVARYGPFVMNTQREIDEAFSDYRGAKNGFENAKTWRLKQ